MLSVRSFLAVVLFAVSFNSFAADDFQPLAPENADLLRAKYLGSPELPDGVAFRVILEFVDSLLPEERDVAVAVVEQEMGLGEAEANEFVDEIVARFAILRRDIDHTHRALACNGNSPAVYGEAVYQVLEAMDDTQDQVSEKHLSMFLKTTDDENASRFSQWIQVQKLSINHVKFKQKDAHERRGKSADGSADALLAAICIELGKER